MAEVYQTIYAALESRLHLIGSVIDAECRKVILAQQMYDKGGLYGNTGYILPSTATSMILAGDWQPQLQNPRTLAYISFPSPIPNPSQSMG